MKQKLFLLFFCALLIFITLGFSNGSLKQSESSYSLSDTTESKEIMKTVQRAYDIEAEAAYTFDLSKFPTVFINDPRFNVSPGTLETIRELTNNPSLESAGWLDYKMAYYSWTRDAVIHAETVKEKAQAENRDLTQKEKNSLVDSRGRSAPARVDQSARTNPLKFLSVNVNGDVAIVIVDDGPMTVQLTLVLVDGHWFIAAYKGIAVHP